MKILKYLLFLILIVIIGGAIYFGTKDGTYDLSNSHEINAPISLVFNKVTNLKEWAEWGPWKEKDSSITFSYGEIAQGEGASYSWDGDTMDGSLKTTSVSENKEVLQDLTIQTPAGDRFLKGYWKFEENEGVTNITWGMKGEHTLMDKVYYALSGMDFNGEINTMQKAGLANIEKVIQSDMAKFTVNVEGVKEHGGGYYLYLTASSKISEIGDKMAPMMGTVAGYMAQRQIAFAGMPFTIYNVIDQQNGTVIFSTAIPVTERIETEAGFQVLCGFMQPTAAVKTILKGNYNNLDMAYALGHEYLIENNIPKNNDRPMFEIYANDPGDFPSPADWETHIYIPILN